MVDELDRCLPEYAIKVLERLHHLTEGVSNVISVIAMDKEQLLSSVHQIFGFDDSAKYLKKFIQFYITLDKGVISEQFVDKHADYVGLFDENLITYEDSIEEFMQAVFSEIGAREQEQLIYKTKLIHNLLFKNPKDYGFMCIELLIMVITSHYNNINKFTKWFERYYNVAEGKENPPFATFFEEKFNCVPAEDVVRTGKYYQDIHTIRAEKSLYGAIAYMWFSLFLQDHHRAIIEIQNKDFRNQLNKNVEELRKFIDSSKIVG